MEAMRGFTSSGTVTGRRLPPDQRTRDGSGGGFQLNTMKGERVTHLGSGPLQPSQGPSPASVGDPGSAGAVRLPRRGVPQQRPRTTRLLARRPQGPLPTHLEAPPWVWIWTEEMESDPTKRREMTRPLSGVVPGEVSTGWPVWDK